MKIIRILSALLCGLICLLPLCACGASSVRDDLSATEVGEKILAALPAGAGHHATGAGYVSASSFGDDYATLLEKTDGYVIYVSDVSDSNVDEIGVFHVTSSGDVKTVKKILEDYVKSQKLRLADLLASYNPGETPKLDNAKVVVSGNYVLFTILSDSDTAKAKEAFTSALSAD